MRILFLTHYFPPEVNAPASRTFEHCKHWVSQGHEVTVVTCVPNHPSGKVYTGYKSRFLQQEKRAGIRVLRVWTYVTPNKGFLKRTINYLTYLIMTILIIPLIPKFDVVISTSPQFFCGLAGYFVSRLKRIPWILEIRDLWPESILAVGAVKNSLIIRLLEWMEMFAYRKAEKIVSLTDAFRNYMTGKGIPPEKVDVVKNGVDLSLFRLLPRDNPVAEELGLNGKFVVSYFGTLGMAHGLDTVLNAAKNLRDQKNIIFVLAGDGAERQRLVALKSEMRLTNVIMLDLVAKEKMPFLLASSDACMVLLRKKELFKTVIPSKMFEVMAMERPIILGVDGESKQIIEVGNCGICIEPESHEELARAITDLYNNPKLSKKLGENGRQFVEKNFNREKLAQDYLHIIQNLNNSQPLRT
jgi:glycosyltransferase involved in cell wall biosynthesis